MCIVMVSQRDLCDAQFIQIHTDGNHLFVLMYFLCVIGRILIFLLQHESQYAFINPVTLQYFILVYKFFFFSIVVLIAGQI